MRGDILAVRHYSWLGNRIRKSTNCEYNHVAMFIDDEWLIEATFKGVKKTHIDTYKKREAKRELDLAVYRITEMTDIETQLMLVFLEDKLGKKYDFLQLLTLWVFLFFGISRRIEPIDNTHKWICSELIAESAYSAGIRFSDKIDPDCISPADIINSNKVRRIE